MGDARDDRGLPPPLADSTAYLLTRALRVSARLAHDEFGREPLRFAHYATLCWVEHLGPCSQIELATAMGIDPSDLVTVLQALEAEGALRRSVDAADRRRRILDVTDDGRRWLWRRREQARRYDEALCAGTQDGGAALRAQLGLIARPAGAPTLPEGG